MGNTLAEKILMHNTGVQSCRPGDIVITKPDMVMFHDIYTPFVYEKFKEMGFTKVWDSEKVAIMLDHLLPTCLKGDARHLNYGYKFADEFGIKNFHASDGISHQLMPELGYAKPGQVVYVTDSHTTTYGAIGCFATGIGYTEMASILGTGELWARVPSALKIQVDGVLPAGVYAKDIILKVLGDIKSDGGTYKSLEFCGSTIAALDVDSRLTIANMVVECGGKVGLFAADEKTASYSGMELREIGWLHFDEDAEYEAVLHYRAEDLVPYVACHPYVDNVHPIGEVTEVEVNEVFIGSCTNSRIEDLRAAAEIAKGRKVAPGVQALVVPGSGPVKAQAEAEGLDKIFIEAGFEWRLPGCSMCLAMNNDRLQPGERCASTSNRNFEGRQGRAGRTHLVSPAMAAAAAVTGRFADIRAL